MEESPYDVLAQIYDAFQTRANIDCFFDLIIDYVMNYLPNAHLESKTVVCDLGCGSGDMALLLAKNHYDVIGLDQSSCMINLGKSKFARNGCDGEFHCQDITDFELNRRVDAFLCLTDTVNHLDDYKSLEALFAHVAKYLNDGGLFIFDALTLDYMKNVLGNKTFCFKEDKYILVWENEFNNDKMRTRSDLMLFLEKENGLYHRSDCTVCEQYYSQDQIEAMLNCSHMAVVEIIDYNDWLDSPKRPVRQIFIARKVNLESKGK